MEDQGGFLRNAQDLDKQQGASGAEAQGRGEVSWVGSSVVSRSQARGVGFWGLKGQTWAGRDKQQLELVWGQAPNTSSLQSGQAEWSGRAYLVSEQERAFKA